ncbi:MAG TPA: sigma factor, partial [Acidimicrobiales bacterium]
MEEPEPALIRAAGAGDLAAFEQLVRAYQEPVWRFLRRLLGDAGVAEDVAQETFLRVFRRLPTFTFEARFS